jgi:uncharacterized protein YggE
MFDSRWGASPLSRGSSTGVCETREMAERTDDSITVTGEAVVSAVPDETRFHITVSAVRDRAEDALHDVTTRSQQLDAVLDELEIPHPKRATTGVSFSEKREWVQERSEHRGFEAKLSIDVAIDDPSRSGRLLQGAVEQARAFVDGPRWRVDPQNAARIEACAEAARDAERKAKAYADALGLRLGPVRSITESPAWGPRGQMLAGARTIAAEEIGIDANLELAASVTITYGIER